MAIPCPDRPTLLSIDGGDYIEYPPGTDISVQSLSQTFNLLFGRSNYNYSGVGWSPAYFNQNVWGYGNSGLFYIAGHDMSPIQLSANDLIQGIDNNKRREIVEKGSPGNWTWEFRDIYNPPNGVPSHTVYTVRFNGINVFGYDPAFTSISTIPITIAYKKLLITTPQA